MWQSVGQVDCFLLTALDPESRYVVYSISRLDHVIERVKPSGIIPWVTYGLEPDEVILMSLRPNADRDMAETGVEQPVVVKKYANRRLYNTESSSYITLDNLAAMVRAGRDFVVYDAKSGDDITRGVLTQIIVEEEAKGSSLLPTGFLRQLIGFYGDSMQALVPRYLEQAMASFARQQQQVRVAMQQTMGNFFPFGMEEMGRQNMALLERTMSLFTPPFLRNGEASGDDEAHALPVSDEIAALRAELASLRDQLSDALAATKSHEPAQSHANIEDRDRSEGSDGR